MKTIFVSSTFRDMDLERDMIQQHVYPRLNHAARQHGQSISFCDLRWGIDTSLLESESGSQKVLDVCLDEIDRCQRPMVVILGYRYGWIPSKALVSSTAARYDLMLDDLEKSVTALEIEYGALADPKRLSNTLFYFREIEGLPSSDYLPEDDVHASHLASLKDRIRTLTGNRVHTYTLRWENGTLVGAEAFADMLCHDLEEILRPQWIQYDAMTPFQKELQVHENYLWEKAAAFRARKQLAQQIMTDIDAGKTLTILTGTVGSGKSTLLSHISLQLRKKGWNTLTLFSNLTPQTGTATDMLKLAVSFLEQELGLEAFRPDAPQGENWGDSDLHKLRNLVGTQGQNAGTSVKQWQQRLDQLCTQYSRSGRKLVILLDAIDQLFPDDLRDDMVFLPAALGENIRFVMTCLPQVHVKGNPVISIPPIDDQDKAQVIQGILAYHNRELSRQVTDAMVRLPASDNPLYLSFLVQRLMMMNKGDFDAIRSFGDGMDAITRHQLAVLSHCPATLDAMSAELMDTAADRVGSDMVGRILNYLALAPHGLRVADLAALLEDRFNLLDFTHFISYMNDCFVIRNDGRYDFSHKSIREGLQRRCQDPAAIHRQLLRHWKSLEPDDDIRRQEIVHHCIHADDKPFYVEYIQHIMDIGDKSAIQYAAKVTHTVCLQDEGTWLIALLEQGTDFGAQAELVSFIYKHYDRQATSRSAAFETLYQIHLSNTRLAKVNAQTNRTFRDWRVFGYGLEALADATEAKGGQQNILEAQTYRKNQLHIAKTLYDLDQSAVNTRFLARAHQNLAVNMQRCEDEDITVTRDHLSQALALRQQLAQPGSSRQNHGDLAKLYLKLAKDNSGWFHSDSSLALEYTQKARAIYEDLWKATGQTEHLVQLAEAYGLLAKLDDFSEELSGDSIDENTPPQNKWFLLQLSNLETAQQMENSILHRQLLAAAYLNYVEEWIILGKDLRRHYTQKAVALYRSIVGERGTFDDLRNLSYALSDASYYLRDTQPAQSVALLEESISIRQQLYDRLALPEDRDFMATVYHTLSTLLDDPRQQEALEKKAKELGYFSRRKAFSEVLEVLRHMEACYIERIPKSVIMFIYDRCDLDYDFRMTKPLAEEKLTPYAWEILQTLLKGFWQDEAFTMGDVRLNRIFGRFH